MPDWFLVLVLALTAPVTAAAPAQRIPQATLTIDHIVRGNQAEIDQGLIVLLYNTCYPADGCPTWLAAHHTTHGAPFLHVSDLRPGDTVSVLGVTYRVTDNTVVCCSGQVFHPTADLTLQTSQSDGRVYIITAARA